MILMHLGIPGIMEHLFSGLPKESPTHLHRRWQDQSKHGRGGKEKDSGLSRECEV